MILRTYVRGDATATLTFKAGTYTFVGSEGTSLTTFQFGELLSWVENGRWVEVNDSPMDFYFSNSFFDSHMLTLSVGRKITITHKPGTAWDIDLIDLYNLRDFLNEVL